MTIEHFRITAGDAPRIASRKAVVLHDGDGNVHHAHYVTTLEGAEGRPLYQHEQDARDIAARYGHDVSKLSALHVERLEIPHGRIRVDVAGGTLVEKESA